MPIGTDWPRLVAVEPDRNGTPPVVSTFPVRCNQCQEAPCVDVSTCSDLNRSFPARLKLLRGSSCAAISRSNSAVRRGFFSTRQPLLGARVPSCRRILDSRSFSEQKNRTIFLMGGLRLHHEFDLGGLLLDLGAYRRRTGDAEIFVLVSLREYQKQFFPHRNRDFTPGTIKGDRLKLIKTRLPHKNIINDGDRRDKTPELLTCKISKFY